MPTLADWQALEPESDEAQVVGEIFRLRPGWLDKGNLTEFEVCRFDPLVANVEPLILEWDEISLFWGMWHTHLLWAYGEPAPRVATEAVETIENILSGRLVRLVAFSVEDRWAGSMLATPEDATLDVAVRQFGPSASRIQSTSWHGEPLLDVHPRS